MRTQKNSRNFGTDNQILVTKALAYTKKVPKGLTVLHLQCIINGLNSLKIVLHK